MALINCKDCGREISDSASVCPYCGGQVSPAGGVTPVRNKEKIVAALFALILGGFGIHFFYLGKTTAGLITLLLSCCSCGIWGLLMFIQGIYMLIISDDEFYAKYVDTDRTLPLF